jgi:DNA processing protein
MTERRPLSDDERLDWLRLSRTEHVGPVTFFALLERCGSATKALAALPDLARRGGRAGPLRIAPRAAAEREIETIARIGGRLIARDEPDYPLPLAAIGDAPPLIIVRGDIAHLARPMIAMVGARNASANGVRFAQGLSAELGKAGFVVVSGLARGIDAGAHRGALDTGTIAVVAGGPDVVYPREHEALSDEIVARGALVSEMPPGTEPQARHFPRRNRIIAGLSRGVIVVEAAPQSGSLITARLALEQGREVFAVPGSPLDPRARGTNDLIRQGAVLTESAADVLDALARIGTPSRAEAGDYSSLREPPAAEIGQRELELGRAAILDLLGPTPVAVDELVRQSGLTAALTVTILLELELAGRLERHPGGKVALSITEY